ncbi:hypothetical protein ACQPZP_01815 [Spirillospora sp. CA-142024]|uniref:hypothetical protein n=1 Tax=Spirillospora sp. CA-142024 TaxID=3240036 RepID=UPI003D8A713F
MEPRRQAEPDGAHGHDDERAALRYQHRSAEGDRAIADGLDALVQADQKRNGDDGAAGSLVPVA